MSHKWDAALAEVKARLETLRNSQGSMGQRKKKEPKCSKCHQPLSTSFRFPGPNGKDRHSCSREDVCRSFQICGYAAGHPELKLEAKLQKLEAKKQKAEAEELRVVRVLLWNIVLLLCL